MHGSGFLVCIEQAPKAKSFLNCLSLFERHETVTRMQKGIKWHDYMEGIVHHTNSTLFCFKHGSLSSWICFHESKPIFNRELTKLHRFLPESYVIFTSPEFQTF